MMILSAIIEWLFLISANTLWFRKVLAIDRGWAQNRTAKTRIERWQALYRRPTNDAAGGPQLRPRPSKLNDRAQWDTHEWRARLEQLLDIRCGIENITVYFHYESSYILGALGSGSNDILQNAQMYIDQNYNLISGRSYPTTYHACEAINMGDGAHKVLFGLQDCNTILDDSFESVLLYRNKVIITIRHTASSEEYSYPISCTYPRSVATFQISPASLSVYGSKFSSTAWRLPHTAKKEEYIYIDGHIDLDSLSYEDIKLLPRLQLFPVNCWSSDNELDLKPTILFVSNGCPAEAIVMGSVVGLSILYYKRNKPVRIAVRIRHPLLPRAGNRLYLHCSALPCLANHTDGLYGYQLCPLAHHCLIRSHHIPWHFNESSLVHAFTGPLIISPAESSTNTARLTRFDPGAQEQSSDGAAGNDQMQTPKQVLYIYYGLSLPTVGLIAFTCFILGVMIAIAVWRLYGCAAQLTKKKAVAVKVENEEITMEAPMLSMGSV